MLSSKLDGKQEQPSIFKDRNPNNHDELKRLDNLSEKLEDLLFMSNSSNPEKQEKYEQLYNITIIQDIKNTLEDLSRKRSKFEKQKQLVNIIIKKIRRLLIKYMFDLDFEYYLYVTQQEEQDFLVYINKFYIKHELYKFINKQDEEDKNSFSKNLEESDYLVFLSKIPEEYQLQEELDYLVKYPDILEREKIIQEKKKQEKLEQELLLDKKQKDIKIKYKLINKPSSKEEENLLDELISILDILKDTKIIDNLEIIHNFTHDILSILYNHEYEKYTKSEDCKKLIKNIMEVLLSTNLHMTRSNENKKMIIKIKDNITNISSAVCDYYEFDNQNMIMQEDIINQNINYQVDQPMNELVGREYEQVYEQPMNPIDEQIYPDQDMLYDQEFIDTGLSTTDNFLDDPDAPQDIPLVQPVNQENMFTEDQIIYLESLGFTRDSILSGENLDFILEIITGNN